MKNEFSTPYLSTEEATSIAADAYGYGFPLVLMDVTRQVMTSVTKPDGRRAPTPLALAQARRGGRVGAAGCRRRGADCSMS